MEGSAKLELTGNLGDVRKESAMTAISYVRSASKKLHINDSFYKTRIYIFMYRRARRRRTDRLPA